VLHGSGAPQYRETQQQTSRREGGAVARRASTIQHEYETHARRLDAEFIQPVERRVPAADVREGRAAPGPVLARLLSFGPIRTLVAGAYSEMSHDLHVLASQVADAGASRSWRHMGCRSETEARSSIITELRSDWGMAAFMGAARLITWRVHEVGLTVEESSAGHRRARRGRTGGEPWDAQRSAQAYADAFMRQMMRPVAP